MTGNKPLSKNAFEGMRSIAPRTFSRENNYNSKTLPIYNQREHKLKFGYPQKTMLKIRDRKTNTKRIKGKSKRAHACIKLVREKCQKLDQKDQTGQTSDKKISYTKILPTNLYDYWDNNQYSKDTTVSYMIQYCIILQIKTQQIL